MRVDYQEFKEWKSGVRADDDDLLHAFTAIKTLSAVKFILTTEENKEQAMTDIREAVEKWH